MPIIFDGHLTEPALPRPTINTVAGDDIISASEQSASITGTAAAGATVMLTFGTGQVTVAANAYGQWSYNLQAADLAAMQVPGVQNTIILARTQLADGTVSYPATRDVHVETAGPQLAVAAVNKNVLMLGYQTLSWLAGTVAVSDYEVKVNGKVVDISMADKKWEGREPFVNKVMLTLANPITASDAVTVSYKAGPSGLQDAAGNRSADYSDLRVSNVTGDTTAPSAPLKLEVVTATGSYGSGLYRLDDLRTGSVRVWLDTKSADTKAVPGDALVLATGEGANTKVLLMASDIAKGYVDFPTFLRVFGPYDSLDSILEDSYKPVLEARGVITASLTDAALNRSATSSVLKVLAAGANSESLTIDKTTPAVMPGAGKADTLANGAMALRLYQAAFDRAPDQDGLTYHTNALDQGLDISQVAANFIASPEFSRTYGNLDDAHFVNQLYRNVLHREADASGLAYHTGNLASGANTRANVLVSFSESQEHQVQLVGSAPVTG